MLPEGWRLQTVADICEFQNGNGFGPEDWGDDGLPIIRIQNMNGGKNFDYYSGRVEPKWVVNTGTLLFAWAGTRGVSFGPSIWRGPTGVLNQHIFKVTPKQGIEAGWLFSALRFVTDRIERSAHGFKASLLHVKKTDIERQIVIVPPIDQQRSIETILSTWDEAITATKCLLINSRQQKQALFTCLLRQSKRLKMVRINDISTKVKRKSDGGDYPVLMISASVGFVKQSDMYSRFMAGKSLDSYVLLNKGEFAYNKGNSKSYEFGCVYPLDSFSKGLVPHVYVCFSLDEKRCLGRFYKYLFEADYLHDQLGALVNTGVRNNGLLNIRPTDFMDVRVPLPPVGDQATIASVLDAATASIQQIEQNLDKLQQEKFALMQQLLTGKRHVRTRSSAEVASA